MSVFSSAASGARAASWVSASSAALAASRTFTFAASFFSRPGRVFFGALFFCFSSLATAASAVLRAARAFVRRGPFFSGASACTCLSSTASRWSSTASPSTDSMRASTVPFVTAVPGLMPAGVTRPESGARGTASFSSSSSQGTARTVGTGRSSTATTTSPVATSSHLRQVRLRAALVSVSGIGGSPDFVGSSPSKPKLAKGSIFSGGARSSDGWSAAISPVRMTAVGVAGAWSAS